MIRKKRGHRARAVACAIAGACVAACAGLATTAAADPPATAPGLVVVNGGWNAFQVAAQDRPDCLGRYTAFDSSQVFDTFRESKETFYGSLETGDPRFDGDHVMFYLHMLRDVSMTSSGEKGAYDGSYAVFDAIGNAIAQGYMQGASVNYSPFSSEEEFVGLFYGGQVLRPSGATIGLPHLVGNFESGFSTGPGGSHSSWAGGVGGYDFDVNQVAIRPAVVVQGGCPGAYTKRPAPIVLTAAAATSVPNAYGTTTRMTVSPTVLAYQQAYVQRLYERAR